MFTISREHQFEEQFSKIAKDYVRIFEIESAIDWFLCRGHSDIKFVSELDDHKNHFLWKTDLVHQDFPQLLILYKVDYKNEEVCLIAVKEIK